MRISRRDFLRYVAASAAALGLTQVQLNKLSDVLADSGSPPVLWLGGSGCSGCSVSLLNAVNPTIDEVLLNTISLKFHPTLVTAAGEVAVDAARATAAVGGYVLVVEGAIPVGAEGRYCYVWKENDVPVTMAEAVTLLAANAARIVAVGTCAAYGGIPAVYGLTEARGLSAFLGRPVINLPGCPAHPDWIIGSLVQLLTGGSLDLDSYGRPTAYYKTQFIHQRCPRRRSPEATQFGQDGLCMERLGCKGPQSHADCDTRLWNNGHGWCIGVNGLCVGCTEPDFPAFPLHSGSVTSDDK